MADNETFRFLGGLGLENLFSVHVRIGACLGVLSGAKTGPFGPILIDLRHFFANFWCSKTTPQKSSFCIAKIGFGEHEGPKRSQNGAKK